MDLLSSHGNINDYNTLELILRRNLAQYSQQNLQKKKKSPCSKRICSINPDKRTCCCSLTTSLSAVEGCQGACAMVSSYWLLLACIKSRSGKFNQINCEHPPRSRHRDARSHWDDFWPALLLVFDIFYNNKKKKKKKKEGKKKKKTGPPLTP